MVLSFKMNVTSIYIHTLMNVWIHIQKYKIYLERNTLTQMYIYAIYTLYIYMYKYIH